MSSPTALPLVLKVLLRAWNCCVACWLRSKVSLAPNTDDVPGLSFCNCEPARLASTKASALRKASCSALQCSRQPSS
eukprot:9681412-Alexandrium_andersonii.AAC.1